MLRQLLLSALVLSPAMTLAQAPPARAMSVFAGSVIDSTRSPIANAEVTLPGLGISKTTNDKGEFRIADVAAGIHRVVVRRIGYGQLDTNMVFAENQGHEWIITLGRIVTLDSVVVEARMDPLMLEFNENRARGFGRFFTRAELAKVEGQSLGGLMMGVSGVGIMQGNGGQNWITSKRGPMTGCQPVSAAQQDRNAALASQASVDECLRRERIYYVPDEMEKRQNMYRACFSLVYLDRSLMNSGKPTPPFDLKTVQIDRIEAIEWYERSSSAPAKYSAINAQCGIAIIHTRRKP